MARLTWGPIPRGTRDYYVIWSQPARYDVAAYISGFTLPSERLNSCYDCM